MIFSFIRQTHCPFSADTLRTRSMAPCKMQGVTSQQFKGKTCSELSLAAGNLRNELAKRTDELRQDTLNLPKTGKFSIGGHITQMEQKQSSLRGILNELAARKGIRCCEENGDNVPQDVWSYATVGAPVRDPRLASVAVALGIGVTVLAAVLSAPATVSAGVTLACFAVLLD